MIPKDRKLTKKNLVVKESFILRYPNRGTTLIIATAFWRYDLVS